MPKTGEIIMKSKVKAINEIIDDLEQGHNNGKMKRISLASFLRSLVPILEAAEQQACLPERHQYYILFLAYKFCPYCSERLLS